MRVHVGTSADHLCAVEVKVAFSQGKRERSIRQQEAQSEAKEDLEINMVGMNQAHPQRAPDGTEKTLSSSSSKSSIRGKSGRAIEPREGRQRLTNQPKDESQDPLPPDRGSGESEKLVQGHCRFCGISAYILDGEILATPEILLKTDSKSSTGARQVLWHFCLYSR